MENNRLALKPLILEAEEAHKSGVIVYDELNNAKLKLPSGEIVIITPEKQFDLTQATIFGLNERLTNGKDIQPSLIRQRAVG